MAFPLTPLGDRLVVKIDEAATEHQVGSLIVVGAATGPEKREVVASAVDSIPVGSFIYIAAYGGNDFELDDVKYRVIQTSDVMGIWNEGRATTDIEHPAGCKNE